MDDARRVLRSTRGLCFSVLLVAGLESLLGCSAGRGAAMPGLSDDRAPDGRGAERSTHKLPASPIQHVVIVIQENRSFDYLFQGYPGANTASSGLVSTGQTVPLTSISMAEPYDIMHASSAFFEAWDNGKLDGFNLEKRRGNAHCCLPYPQYGYAPSSEIQPYLAMAGQYVLADNMFASQLDGSFTAHQYLVAAYSGRAVNFPKGAWGCGPPAGMVHTLNDDHTIGPRVPACYNYATLADKLDAAHVSWRMYAPPTRVIGHLWLSFNANSQIHFGPDGKNDITEPETQFLTDVASGQLAAVTWIIPRLRNSDHTGSGSTNGPPWVASIVNAVGQSPFWNSSLIFVVWDDWGGWYDHVEPPLLDYDGPGFRVPLLCISPYAFAGVVNHTQLEHASILKFVEKNWGLVPLAAADERATSAGAGCINHNRTKPRPFKTIPAQPGRAYFLHDPAPDVEPDDE
jgi:phospholipase C